MVTHIDTQGEMLKLRINISHFTRYIYLDCNFSRSLFRFIFCIFFSCSKAAASVFLIDFVKLNQMTRSEHGRGIFIKSNNLNSLEPVCVYIYIYICVCVCVCVCVHICWQVFCF